MRAGLSMDCWRFQPGRSWPLISPKKYIANGQIQGVVPKSYLPNYGEFYEARQFSSGDYAVATEIDLLGERVHRLSQDVADLAAQGGQLDMAPGVAEGRKHRRLGDMPQADDREALAAELILGRWGCSRRYGITRPGTERCRGLGRNTNRSPSARNSLSKP